MKGRKNSDKGRKDDEKELKDPRSFGRGEE
jgi:hypothetical protein